MCDELTTTTPTISGPDLASYTGPTAGLVETAVDVTTPDGQADAVFVHPAAGKHPGVVLWPDALGAREAQRAMARRLAAAGYAVLAVNPYYRTLHGALGMKFEDFATAEGRQSIMKYMGSLTPDGIERDGAAYVAFLDGQDAVDTRRGIGVQGYCFSGAFAIRTAAARPDRVKAVACFHAGGLVTDTPESPHRQFGRTQAAYLVAIAQDDDRRAPTDKDTLRAAVQAAGKPAEIEVYRGDHGWCVPDAPAYDEAEGDRTWQRLLALYSKL